MVETKKILSPFNFPHGHAILVKHDDPIVVAALAHLLSKGHTYAFVSSYISGVESPADPSILRPRVLLFWGCSSALVFPSDVLSRSHTLGVHEASYLPYAFPFHYRRVPCKGIYLLVHHSFLNMLVKVAYVPPAPDVWLR